MPTASDAKRSGRPRRTVRAQVLREESHCWLCDHRVDVTMGPRHPLSPEVDEIVPVKHGGSTTDRTNLRLAHRICNQTRCAKPATHQVRATCRAKVELLLNGGSLPTKARRRPTATQREQRSNPRW